MKYKIGLNLHSNIIFILLLVSIVFILTLFEKYQYYYNAKSTENRIKIAKLEKDIRYNLKKCYNNKKEEQVCIEDLEQWLNQANTGCIIQVKDINGNLIIDINQTKDSHKTRTLIEIPKPIEPIQNYNYSLYIAQHTLPNLFFATVRSITFSRWDFYVDYRDNNISYASKKYNDHNSKRSLYTFFYFIIVFIILVLIRYSQKTINNLDKSNNPKLLVNLLTNFTIDTPIKYTTHEWRKRVDKEYVNNFDLFIDDVTTQLEKMKDELNELSPNLYQKIYDFIISKEPSKNSWCRVGEIKVGWSSLDGLREWVNEGNEPFDFILKDELHINGTTIVSFGKVIELFKNEIEIREDMLQNIFLGHKKALGRKFKISISDNLKGEKFYTDVESFIKSIDEIFKEISKYAKENNAYNIEIELHKPNTNYINLHIIHVNSTSHRSANELQERVHLKGDLVELSKLLINLCDWSIKANNKKESFQIECFDKNSTPKKLIETPKGFTHIMRFYK